MNTVTPFDLAMQPPLCSVVWCNTGGIAPAKLHGRSQRSSNSSLIQTHTVFLFTLDLLYKAYLPLTSEIVEIEVNFTTLCRCFLFIAGDAGWPGLGTPLEAADPVPEWRRAERSMAERTPKPPGPIPVPATPGACCWDTFCNSAANCLGSTPGERCPPTVMGQMLTVMHMVFLWNRYTDTCMHADITTNTCTYQP